MNKKDLEKIFDERFNFYIKDAPISVVPITEVKNFIFETIIPEVLKSVLEIKDSGAISIDFLEDFIMRYYNKTKQ